MWLFCKSGFFSAVQNFEKPELIHVRARFRGDLEKICEAHGIKPEVKETPFNDYRFRMDFPRQEWAKIVEAEANSIDYPNFKNEVHDGTERDSAYMRCWSAMRSAQE